MRTFPYAARSDGPDPIFVTAPLSPGASGASPDNRLYAAARGTHAIEYGPSRTPPEDALDALAASLVVSRGASAAGVAWEPSERALLPRAAHALREEPARLAEVAERVEQRLYPPLQARGLGVPPHVGARSGPGTGSSEPEGV